MIFSTVLISGREWLLPAVGVLCVFVLLLGWTYYRAPAARGHRTWCLLLKLLGLTALLACLLEPLWSGERARPGANYFAVVADNSAGMRIKDRGESRSRADELAALLAPQNPGWLGKLKDNFRVRRYYFDSRLQNTRDFSELSFDGRASAIGGALRALGERFRGQPLAGILLLTDGNATDLPAGRLEAPGLPPVYPVVMGRDDPIKDIALQKVAVSQTVFEDAPVTIQADAEASGYQGRPIVAQLLDQAGKVVMEDTQRSAHDGDGMAFRFELRPEHSGISFYQLRVAARNELKEFAHPETSAEATLANNSRAVVVDRGRGPYKILYLSGRPTWEFKFLNRALDEDDQLQLKAIIRIARREPKFVFRGTRARPPIRCSAVSARPMTPPRVMTSPSSGP